MKDKDIILKTFKKMLFVLCNSGLTAEQIGITQKQYSGIKYYNQGEALFVCGSRRMRVNVLCTQEELDSFGSGGGL